VYNGDVTKNPVGATSGRICVVLIKQMEDDEIERKTTLHREDNRYVIERTVKRDQVSYQSK